MSRTVCSRTKAGPSSGRVEGTEKLPRGVGCHPHPGGARAQFAQHLRGYPAREVRGGDRGQWLRQEHPRLRYFVRRRATSVPGLDECLRSPVCRSDVPAGCGSHHGVTAVGQYRAGNYPGWWQEYGGHRDRGVPLHPPAVRPIGSPAVPRLCCSRRGANSRGVADHLGRGSPQARATEAAGSSNSQSQGVPQRGGRMGSSAGLS